MKKAVAYVVVAMVLGFAMMMLPKTQEPLSTTETSRTGGMSNYLMPSSSEEGSKPLPYVLVSQPQNLLPSSLVVFSGLVAALSLYIILKKRPTLRS